MVVLDTDHVTLLEWARGVDADRLRARLDDISPKERATTIVTYEEQTRGWLAYVGRARTLVQQIDAYRKLSRHLEVYRSIRVLEFDERAALEMQRLRTGGVRVGPMDLKIAAIVLAHDSTLLSRNLRDFRKVPGLRVEDWTV
jgi:tRNA(fMet)-specific endonuclease VapC